MSLPSFQLIGTEASFLSAVEDAVSWILRDGYEKGRRREAFGRIKLALDAAKPGDTGMTTAEVDHDDLTELEFVLTMIYVQSGITPTPEPLLKWLHLNIELVKARAGVSVVDHLRRIR